MFWIYKFELVLENLDKYYTSGARLSVALFEQWHPDRVPGVQAMARPPFPTHHLCCRTADVHRLA
jgi:hypothetical protein